MKVTTSATLDTLVKLRTASAYVTALAESVIVGGISNQHNGLALLPAALDTLETRVAEARAALESEPRR